MIGSSFWSSSTLPNNPLLVHIVPPFVDKKDPMFHLQINGEAIWKWREVYGHPRKATRAKPVWSLHAIANKKGALIVVIDTSQSID